MPQYGYPPGMPVPMFYPPPIIPAITPQANVPMNPDSTGYFGNLSPAVSDDVLSAILSCSGGFKRLKRPVDPSNGKAKPFAFVEYESATDLSRAFRLLQDFPLDNRHFNIKIESSVPGGVVSDISEDLNCFEGIQRVLIGKRLTSGSNVGSMDWLDEKISQLKKSESEERSSATNITRKDPRQRNYDDLLTEESFIEVSNSKMTDKSDGLIALKDRERRWESIARELERDFRRDLLKDEERSNRHAKDSALLAEQISVFSDAGNEMLSGNLERDILSTPSNETSSLFYADRQKWRALRRMASEREKEIFKECAEIQRKLTANLIEKERDMIEKVIPVQRDELFSFPVKYERLNGEMFNLICKERSCAFFSDENKEICEKLGELIYKKISQDRCAPSNLLRDLSFEPVYLAVSSESGQAEVFLMIIWRWLIYFTSDYGSF